MAFPLTRYFERIGYDGLASATADVLRAVHRAHASAIAFENADVLAGSPIRLDLKSLEAKLIARRRGGYCHEQNSVFGMAMRQLGFDVTPMLGRPQVSGGIDARTHLFHIVRVDGVSWIADVGFCGWGPAEPVPLDGTPSIQAPWTYEVRFDDRGSTLRVTREHDGSALDLYSFGGELATAADVEVANFYTSSHPASIFRNVLLASIVVGSTRHRLASRDYLVTSETNETRAVVDEVDIVPLLRDVFRIDVDHVPVPRRQRERTSVRR